MNIGFLLEFFDMVKLFYDKAATLLEPHLIDTYPGRISREEKAKRVTGILNLIKPCIRYDLQEGRFYVIIIIIIITHRAFCSIEVFM